MGIRLWHQSSSDMTNVSYQESIKRLTERILPGATIDVHGVLYPPENRAEDAPELRRSDFRRNVYAEMLTEVQAAHNAIQAEQEGYDAFIYTCFNDPGILQARSMVDIPVIGMCETSLLVGHMFGRAIALIPRTVQQGHIVTRTVQKHRLNDHVHCMIPMDLGHVEGGPEDAAKIELAAFEKASREAIARGADLLISAEGRVNVMLAEMGITDVDGVRVLDSFSTQLQFAKMFVELRQATGVSATPSRSRDFIKIPQDAVAEVAQYTAAVLTDGWRQP